MADERPPERPVNGVMVHRRFEQQRGLGWGVDLELVGDMRPTELVSVLRVALAAAERQASAVVGDRSPA